MSKTKKSGLYKITISKFNKLLQNHKVPHYARIRCYPEQFKDYYGLSPINAERKIRTGTNVRKKRVRINSKNQRSIFNKLSNLKELKPYIIGISSSPNDYLAMETASLLLYSLLNKFSQIDWRWINSNFNLQEDSLKPDIAIIYNLIPERERLYKVRDTLDYFTTSLRLVVIGGTDPIDYFDNYLRYPLSGAININSVSFNNDYWKSKNNIDGKEDEDYPLVITKDIREILSKATED